MSDDQRHHPKKNDFNYTFILSSNIQQLLKAISWRCRSVRKIGAREERQSSRDINDTDLEG